MKKITIGLKEVVLIILSLIIGAIFSPVSDIISQGTINLFNSVNSGFSDYYYTSMAKLNPNAVNYHIVNYIMCIISILFVGYYLYLKDKSDILENSLNKITFKINNIESETNTKTVDLTELKKSLSIIKSRNSTVGNTYPILLLLSMSFVILISINYSILKSISSENAKFNNKIIVISPYVENQEILKIKSDWVRMKNVNDYNKIQDKIKSVYSINSIEE